MNNKVTEVISRFFSHKPSKTDAVTPVQAKSQLVLPEDSMLRRHFLTQLRSVVEAEMLPDAMDSSLRHYYEASVAAEFQKRLAG